MNSFRRKTDTSDTSYYLTLILDCRQTSKVNAGAYAGGADASPPQKKKQTNKQTNKKPNFKKNREKKKEKDNQIKKIYRNYHHAVDRCVKPDEFSRG